jgi:adenylate kinase family enzyme
MIQGIAIFGLNGGGKSTLTHALAKQIAYYEMDVEDYYFPEQRESRKWALENNSVIDTEHLDELPFSNPRTKSKVQTAIMENIKTHPRFIISGVTMNWSDVILSRIDIAFWVQTPLEESLKRIQARKKKDSEQEFLMVAICLHNKWNSEN